MKKRIILLSGIVALVLICMIGACAAEETNTAVVTTTAGEIVTAPTIGDISTSVSETSVTNPDLVDGSGIDDEIAPYDGPVGPGNPLYGLKVAFEDLDESFTFNETERLNKQMNNARLRLSEVKRELVLNNTDSANRALDLYWQKTNITQMRLNTLSSSNATGLLHAQEMVTKHQIVLEGLMLSHPDNTGLVRAYSNSLALETKFEQKTQTRFERVMEKNNKTIIKAVRLEVREQERTTNTGQNQTVQVQQTQKIQQAEGTGKPDTTGDGKKVTVRQTPNPAQTVKTVKTMPEPTATQGNTGNAKPQNTGNSNNDNRGQVNGRNK